MLSDHTELITEMLMLEKMAMIDRLKLAKKRRAQQLKAYAAYEKQINKDGGKRFSKLLGKTPSTGTPAAGNKPKTGKKGNIHFEPSTLLLDAASRNDRDEVYMLLSKGISPNSSNEDGLTALHQCCIDNMEDIVKLLIQFGANVNARDTELWTPLHAAATCGHTSLCKHLCENRAELLAVNIDGNMPYDLCEDGKTLDYIESQMAKAGITQDMIDDIRLTTEKEMLIDLKKIQAEGGDLERKGPKGETALHVAASNGYIHVTQFLLKQNVAVDCVDDDDWQPIHCAACWGQLNVVELLLQNKANPEALTRTGESAIDLCEDLEVRAAMLRMMKDMAQQHLMPRKMSRFGFDSSRRRSSASRRGSTVAAHGIRRASIHDRAPFAHREAAEEAQRLQESMASMSNIDDEDEEDGVTLDAVTLPPSSLVFNESNNEATSDSNVPVTSSNVEVTIKSALKSSGGETNNTPNIVITAPQTDTASLAPANGTAEAAKQSKNLTREEENISKPSTDSLSKNSLNNVPTSSNSASASDDSKAQTYAMESEDAKIKELQRLRHQKTSSTDERLTQSESNGSGSGTASRRNDQQPNTEEQSLRDRIMSSSVKKKFSNTNEVVRCEEKEQAGCCLIM